MSHHEFNFHIYNTEFYGQYWKPKTVNAVVILVHGMGEHSGRYANYVVPQFIKNNIAIVTFDHFGHGKTEGKRGHNPNFEAVLDSIATVIDKANTLFPNKPVFLYGHSMGGNAVINYALRRKNHIKGVIATSPFLRLAFQPPAWKLTLGKLMQKIAPSITLGNELNVSAISRDQKEVEKYINDPLVHDKVSPNFSITFIKTGEWAIQNASNLKTPMLVLHGTNDKITDCNGSSKFVENSNKIASLKLFEEGYHELHNDLCKEEMVAEMINWIITTN